MRRPNRISERTGGNFGVAVGFDFIARPVTSVHFGSINYRVDDLPGFVAGWRDLMRASDAPGGGQAAI